VDDVDQAVLVRMPEIEVTMRRVNSLTGQDAKGREHLAVEDLWIFAAQKGVKGVSARGLVCVSCSLENLMCLDDDYSHVCTMTI
jgi:hypothetical protein